MRHITLHSGQADKPLLELDLGEASRDGDYDDGDLGFTAGNLYLVVDGEEWGSLYFHAGSGERPGGPTITLGQYDAWSENWEARNPLDDKVYAERDRSMDQLILAAARHWDGDDNIIQAHLAVQAELIAGVMPERPGYQNHAWIMQQIRNAR